MSYRKEIVKGVGLSPADFVVSEENITLGSVTVPETLGTWVGKRKIVFAGTDVPSNDENAVGILYHDADVTFGDQAGSAVIKGTVNGEVLDVSVQAAAVLNKNGLEFTADESHMAGLCVDYENRTFERLGIAKGKNAGADFDSFLPMGGRKRCILQDDGTVTAWYGDEAFDESGANGEGMVMVYQPAFFYKVEPLKLEPNTDSGIGYHTRKANYWVSDRPARGFKLHPAFYNEAGKPVDHIYFSAYEGALWDASEVKYYHDGEVSAQQAANGIEPPSYISEDAPEFEGQMDAYYALAATDDLDLDADKLSSAEGLKPISGLHLAMNKTNMEKCANNHGDGWHLETIKATSANQLLMMIELGTMNTQTAIGQGVVSIADNSAYNCASLTGSTSELGNGTGQATTTVNEKGGATTEETASGKVSITYRGVENPWGNIWKHINGVNIWGDGSMAGGQPYVAEDFTFNESKHDGNYHPVGFTIPKATGYINAMGYGSEEFDWLLMPSETGGTSALPVGDYAYVTANLNGYGIALLGGNWNYGGSAGGFYWACDHVVGFRRRDDVGRLLYVPQ